MKQRVGTAEAAALLGISRVAVFKRIRKGEIRAEKIGRNYVIETSSLGLPFAPVSEHDKKEIRDAVGRVVREFAPALKRLGRE
ncbi:MAG: DNA-binding protein [Actinobacteria bacterium]|nr:MAG: DNA-binding protein [Actinomycetota bacterium]